ncbi:MAG: MotA/TolQ/ExbB proton channel family protein [Desulfamplus sp.]|nr:MotA/TolQ/ExbB proton channel family protein [Desulfamplus sp.]
MNNKNSNSRGNNAALWELPSRLTVLGISFIAGCIFVGVLWHLIGDTMAGIILLDSKSELFKPVFPITIQNIMHIQFFIGLGELYVRWRVSTREQNFIKQGFLPEDDETVLQFSNLGDIRRQTANRFDQEHGFLPSLIDLCILQFQSSRSIDQVVSVLNSNLELIAHRVDLRYSMIRYIVWVIPTFGFIGTVIGISYTLAIVDPAAPDLKKLTESLAVAFNTTLVALLLSAVLVFLLHIVQRIEEQSVNSAGYYTLRNLINRLYTGGN